MSIPKRTVQSVAVIGGGIIGLSCALALADRGVRVTIYDINWPPRGASWAAAGMLAPAFEAAADPDTHPDLFRLCDVSAQLWPDWAARLQVRSGLPSGYLPGPSLAVATTRADAEMFRRVETILSDHPLAPIDCTSTVHEVEPAVTRDARAALLLPSDGQADNRQTLDALIACITGHDQIQVCEGPAPLCAHETGLDHAGHDATLIAAGWQSGSVEVASGSKLVRLADLVPLFDKIKTLGGQMLAVAPIEQAPKMTVRCGHLYIVPKPDRIIIGATTEPGRILEQADPVTIADLRRQAIDLCPVLAEAPVIESWVGVRPGTRDHAPILGETNIPGLFAATGHYRNGILLAPITAKIVADLIVEGRVTDLGAAFAPKLRDVEQV